MESLNAIFEFRLSNLTTGILYIEDVQNVYRFAVSEFDFQAMKTAVTIFSPFERCDSLLSWRSSSL